MTTMLITMCIVMTGLAQDDRAQELFDGRRHQEVMEFYTRNYKKGLSSADLRLLSRSMLMSGLNEDALGLVQRTFLEKPNDPHIVMALIEALIFNGQYSTAYFMLEEYEDMDFDQQELYDMAKKAAILHQWEKREASYEVTSVEAFNTPRNEFALYIEDGKRIFCSSQNEHDLLYEQHEKSRKEYTSLYQADGDTAAHKPFANGRFKGKFNVGPFDFCKDKFYFTFSDEMGQGENQLQILVCDAKNPSVANAVKAIDIPGSYSVAHPTFSGDGQRMLYSSDMPGGEGGMDLYYSVRSKTGWSSPISLGDVVNTPGNEVFPRIIDGQIYFSSSGHPGYGGLDIFVVTDDSFREDLRNLYAPINSPYDDFAYLRTGESSGYFTSNRPGGKGGDDIFYYSKRKVEPDMRLISGIMEVEGIPQQNVKVLLTDENDNIIEQAYTDINGVFYFNRDPEGGEFNIKMVPLEGQDASEVDLFLTDNQGRKSKKIKADKEGNFAFELLALDDFYADYIDVEDNTLFAIKLYGQLFHAKPGDLNIEREVALLNKRGIVRQEAESSDNGYFQFYDVVPEDRYWFYSPEIGPKLKMAMLDQGGKIIAILEQDDNGRFVYDRPYDEGEFISLYNEDMELVTVEREEAINLPDILYDHDSFELKGNSKAELDRLIGILENNEKLRIELSSHTDSRGQSRYNEDLSAKRAREAWGYIVSHGIDSDRIVAVGKGETKPINDCRDGVSCNEEEHAVNRRTEFRILSN
jgi:outer membrane protein OmpA-like peptidoglycan-associated protein